MRRLLMIAALAVAASPTFTVTPVYAAPHEWHACPTEAHGTVTHNGDSSWVATTQSSSLIDMRVAPIGGIVALICVYHMFGGDYWIYKRPSPAFVSCRPQRAADGSRGFYCAP
jgi:hypothetical protein